MEIEEGIRSPPEICSNILDLTKKRKFESEEFELPSSKHKCLNLGFTPSIRNIIKEDISLVEESESQHESAKDSNSFAEDSDSAMSSYQHKQYPCETTEEHLLEFGFDEDYSFFESENDCLKMMVDKELVQLQNLRYPYAVNQSNYILSSEQFSTIQETTAERTIDQEFEDHFAALLM